MEQVLRQSCTGKFCFGKPKKRKEGGRGGREEGSEGGREGGREGRYCWASETEQIKSICCSKDLSSLIQKLVLWHTYSGKHTLTHTYH